MFNSHGTLYSFEFGFRNSNNVIYFNFCIIVMRYTPNAQNSKTFITLKINT